jgi:hypothetical protein
MGKFVDHIITQDIMLEYKDYLNTTHWKNLREIIITKRKCCCICESTKILNVHHLTYTNLWFEKDKDLVLLCQDCHYKLHKQLNKKKRKISLKSFSKQYIKKQKKHINRLKKELIRKQNKINWIKINTRSRKLNNKLKIFDLEPNRALKIMEILENLNNKWECNFKKANLCGISHTEWLKTQHFFLCEKVMKNKDKIIDKLKLLINN